MPSSLALEPCHTAALEKGCRAESEQPEWQILLECEKEIAEGIDFPTAVEMCLESSEHSVLEESSPWKHIL